MFAAILFVALNARAETSASRLLTELKAKREALPSLHQEFEVSQTSKTVHDSQSLKREIVLDMCQEKWLENTFLVSNFAGIPSKDMILSNGRGHPSLDTLLQDIR
jgi:hypothetical protein